MLTPPCPLPRHRLPADVYVAPRLAAGHFVLCPWHPRGQGLETQVMLETELDLVDPDGADCLVTQVLRSKGSFN